MGSTGELRTNSYRFLFKDIPVMVNQDKFTFISSMQILRAMLRTYRLRWPITRYGESESNESMLATRFDDDDDDDDDDVEVEAIIEVITVQLIN